MGTSSTYLIPTDPNTISAIAGFTPPTMLVSVSLSKITPNTFDVSSPYPPPPLPAAPTPQDYNPQTDPEGNLSAFPAFFGGVGTDMGTGQPGDPGNYIGAGASQTYSSIVVAGQGKADFTQIGTDLNNGSEIQAWKDLGDIINKTLPTIHIETPPGNVGAGIIKLTKVIGTDCFAMVGAAGIAAMASKEGVPKTVVTALMSAALVSDITTKCVNLVANPDADEVAVYDSVMHAVILGEQTLGTSLEQGGFIPQSSPSLGGLGGAGGTVKGGGQLAGWNLTNTGATIDWTKGFIDSTNNHAVRVVA